MKKLPLLLTLFIVLSCSPEPFPIEYGEDQCAACKMIISDSRFGCELVTTKGKVYKYDAIECLVPEVIKNGTDHYSFILVSDYKNPGKLIDVKEAAFKIDPGVPSPMGGNLSAYTEAQMNDKDEYLDWVGLVTTLSRIERYSNY